MVRSSWASLDDCVLRVYAHSGHHPHEWNEIATWRRQRAKEDGFGCCAGCGCSMGDVSSCGLPLHLRRRRREQVDVERLTRSARATSHAAPVGVEV
jgi:hypothetical protein